MYTNKGFLPEVERARKIALLRSNPRGRLEVFFHNLTQKVCMLEVKEMKYKILQAYLNFFYLNDIDNEGGTNT